MESKLRCKFCGVLLTADKKRTHENHCAIIKLRKLKNARLAK